MSCTSFDIFDKESHYGQLVHNPCFSLYINEFKKGNHTTSQRMKRWSSCRFPQYFQQLEDWLFSAGECT